MPHWAVEKARSWAVKALCNMEAIVPPKLGYDKKAVPHGSI